MEDYIFILIVIVLSVLSAINRKKKAQSVLTEDMQEDEREDSLLKHFLDDDFFGEDEAESIVPAPAVQKRSQKPAPPVNVIPPEVRPFLEYELKRKGKPPRKRGVSKQLEIIRTESAGEKKGANHLEDFSLRKAVVYSEILHPKYLNEFNHS